MDGPLPGFIVPAHRSDPCSELDVPPQIEAVGYVLKVGEDGWLIGISFGPRPFLLEISIEAKGIFDTFNIATSTWVSIPIPGAAYTVPSFENPCLEARPVQAV
jgi:hypothetical protein